MARISTYPIISEPTLNDLLIGTDVEDLNITKNFTIGDIASLIIGGSYVPYIGATENVDLGAFDITSSAFIVGGGLATQFLKADGSLDATIYQPAGNYITQLSGEATASGPGNATVTLSNSAVINKVLTGLNITGAAIVATDSILTAFGKVQNQINTLVGGVQYKGTWNAATNTPTLVSSVGVQGNYYVVNVAGNTNLNGITDWNLGDWAIFNGSAWEKVDNTDAVISVNGQVGAVVLTTTNIAEGTNLYYTDLRARSAISLTTTGNSGISTYSNLTGILNVPNYTLAGLGGVPLTRELTINGTTFDLSANRSWSVGTVTSIATTGPLTGGTITGSGTIGITQSGASSDGYLSSTDWNTFNNKQNAITNPVTGTGTPNTLPMWGSTTSLVNSPLSYASDAFNFQYNSATGGTVNFTNIGLTAYTYAIQMNNFGSPRSTVHSYTDGVVVQSIGGTQVSRMFANGNFILGTGVVDNGYKLEVSGNLYLNSIVNATTDTDRFIVSDGGIIKYRTGTQLLSDIGAQGALTLTTTGTSGAATLISNVLNIPQYTDQFVGTVTSVGLSMPPAFTVSNSPVTSAGTLTVVGAGNATQYVRGDGALATLPTSGTGGGASVSYYLNGSVNQGTIGGVTYYEMNRTPIIGAGTDFTRNTNGYIASFLTDAGDPALLAIPAGNWNFETYFNASSGGGSPTFYLELYKYNGTTFTLIASNSGSPKLINDGTSIEAYFSALAVPQTTLTLTDRLAIRIYVTTSGRTITLHTEGNHLCQIITTFTTGLTALNGLTNQVQFFATGTSGTDFNILSAVDTHTFNLPTASAVNRGALSSADWTTFNNKQNALTNPVTGTGSAGQVAYWSSSSEITGESEFTYDSTNNRLGVGATSANALTVLGTSLFRGSTSINNIIIDPTISTSSYVNSISHTNVGLEFNNNSASRGYAWSVNSVLRWSILNTGILQSNGAQTIQTSTGNLTLATAAENGNILLAANGTGVVDITKNDRALGAELRITNAFNGSGWLAGDIIGTINFVSSDTSNPENIRSQIQSLTTDSVGTYASRVALVFKTAELGTLAERWRIGSTGILQSNGAQTIQTSTGNLTLATAGGNGNILITTNGTGNVGINNSAPSVALEVAGTGASGVIRSLRTTGGVLNVGDHAGRISLGTSSGSAAFIGAQIGIVADSTWTTGTSQPSSFVILTVPTSSTTLTEKMRITSGGNVGIGTDIPSQRLQVFEGGLTTLKTYSTTNAGAILVGYQSELSPFTKTTDLVAGSDGTTPSQIRFITRTAGQANLDERMRIFSDGNVFIGSSPSNAGFRLDVNGTARVQGVLTASANNTTGVLSVINSNSSASISMASLLAASATGDTYFTIGRALTNNNSALIGHSTVGGGNYAFITLFGRPANDFAITSTGSIGIGTSLPNASARLQIDSTTQGFLPPRMTAAQRTAIASPAEGLIVYQTDSVIGLYIYANATWRTLGMI